VFVISREKLHGRKNDCSLEYSSTPSNNAELKQRIIVLVTVASSIKNL
jgi:hypothetical protein